MYRLLLTIAAVAFSANAPAFCADVDWNFDKRLSDVETRLDRLERAVNGTATPAVTTGCPCTTGKTCGSYACPANNGVGGCPCQLASKPTPTVIVQQPVYQYTVPGVTAGSFFPARQPAAGYNTTLRTPVQTVHVPNTKFPGAVQVGPTRTLAGTAVLFGTTNCSSGG